MRSAAKLALLPILLLVLHAVAFGLAGVGQPVPEVAPTPASMLLMVAMETVALVAAVALARDRGWPLVFATFLAYFGAKSFMSQIESLFFVSEMSTEQVLRVVAAGLLIAAIFAPAAVWALGKASRVEPVPPLRAMTRSAWRWAAVPLAYLTVYFVFGYYVAWTQPEVRAFYRGEDPTGFWPHLTSLLGDDPWLIPFQFLRAGLWTALALPLLRRLGGSPLQAGLAIGALLGVSLTAQLLLANPFMPEPVRMIHFVETLPSTFLFGTALGILLLEPDEAQLIGEWA